MTSRSFVALAVAVAVLLLPATAAAEADPPPPLDTPLHLLTPSTVETDGGSILRLPPGYFLDEPMWINLDTELRRAQDAETRLTTENESLRESVNRAPPGGWRTLMVVGAALAAGIAIGAATSR